MEDFNGYKVGLFINNSTLTPSPNLYSFNISDNIYSAFPTLSLSFPDSSGLFLEFGNFIQGVLLKINFGIASLSDMFDVNFRSTCRDAVSPTAGTPGLNANIAVNAKHDSFFINRMDTNTAFKEVLVSDAVKKLFSSEKNLIVETTKGKIESYAFDEPYEFTHDVLLPQATNGKIRPFMFFRNLLNELHFESINLLENKDPAENLTFGSIDGDNAYNTLNSFLPYNENLDKTLMNFHVMSKIFKNDLSFIHDERTVATDAKNLIPVITNARIHHHKYFHRQFNPKVDYDQLNNGFYADAMRAGFFVDKAACSLPLHTNLVAGKTVNVSVSVLDSNGDSELSETFSGKWLIEQSHHSWDAGSKRGMTSLILCRSSMIPRKDSIIADTSFKD